MISSFTDTFDIDKQTFASLGAFDPVIGVDSRLFIDPALLDECEAPEFADASQKVEEYFGAIITLLEISRHEGDASWKKAERLLTFTEIRGTCLGYCRTNNTGTGIGPTHRRNILESVCALIKAGVLNLTIFELIGVFEEKIGADRISDLLTHILRSTIARYTARVSNQLGYRSTTINYAGFTVPKNPVKNEPILLLPKDVLSPLPLAMSMGDIDYVCSVNEGVRKVINEYFPWEGKRRKLSKALIKQTILEHADFASALIDAYRTLPRSFYDFDADRAGERRWYDDGKSLAQSNPFDLHDTNASPKDIARSICNQFKHLIEDNGAWRLLYDEEGSKPRTERYSQNLFMAVASSYCSANNLDIDVSPEPNAGSGPVDFKLTRGAAHKCLVELKMSSSSSLKHCLDTQIPTYMDAEAAEHAIYLLIQTGNEERVTDFIDYYQGQPSEVRQRIALVVVDARPKKSASKR